MEIALTEYNYLDDKGIIYHTEQKITFNPLLYIQVFILILSVLVSTLDLKLNTEICLHTTQYTHHNTLSLKPGFYHPPHPNQENIDGA